MARPMLPPVCVDSSALNISRDGRRNRYVALCALALAFAWVEASVVVYLRDIAARENALHAGGYAPDVQVVLASLPAMLVAVEIVREACTLVLLAAGAWLGGRRTADRVGAFLLAFGIWDLAYYAVLRLVSGWPESIGTWDILFLIPSPWVAPVWAPAAVATIFIAGGSYLFWTSERSRRYRALDAGVLIVATGLTLAAFLAGSNAVLDHRLPERFPLVMFWSGVLLGVAWFTMTERQMARTVTDGSPWVGVRVQALVPGPAEVQTVEPGRNASGERAIGNPREEHDLDRIVAEYRQASSRLERLVSEATELAERFERLAHGLSTRPRHLIVGLPDEDLANTGEFEIVPSHPLPTIEHLTELTDTIRAEGSRVDDLRERLLLLGHSDLVEQPNRFFH